MSSLVLTPTPQSFTFKTLVQQQLTWVLTDENGNPISGSILTATLYANRSRTNPAAGPGVADPVFNNISLIETPTGSGVYIGTISEAFNPSPVTTWFVLVIVAVSGSTTIANFEIPAIVAPPQNSVDLVLLDDVKSYLGIDSTNTADDKLLQILITSFSQYVLNMTGMSSFKQINTYTEYYDGNGNTRLMLRNYPVQSLISLVIGSYTVPFSTSTLTGGIYVEDSQKSIAFRWSSGLCLSPLSIYPYYFAPGQGNIRVVYTAGYNFVPFDLQEAVIEACAQNYRRKDWIDLASKALSTGSGGSGTTTYRSWAISPSVQMVIGFYSRYSRT